MKHTLIITIATLCILQQSNITAGYGSTSTANEEEKERAGSANDAYITTTKEETARMQPVDDAYTTENAEEAEHQAGVNDAATTWAAEMAERS